MEWTEVGMGGLGVLFNLEIECKSDERGLDSVLCLTGVLERWNAKSVPGFDARLDSAEKRW